MIPTAAFRWSLLVLLALATPGWGGDGGPAGPPRIPDRYLLVVDCSSPMRSRAEAVRESVGDLVMSGIRGTIQDGDQLGLWTYNNELHTGEFGLIEWNGADRAGSAQAVVEYLEGHRQRRSTDFSQVLPHLLDVVAESHRITVIVWSDGDERFQGTPFDDAINAYFLQHAEDLKEQRAPFVTVLRGYGGRLMDYRISFPPFPIELPPFPPEPSPPPETVASPPPEPAGPDLSRTLVTTNKGPIVFAEPLIVKGSQGAPPPASPTQTVSTAPIQPTNTAPPLAEPPVAVPSNEAPIEPTPTGLVSAVEPPPPPAAEFEGEPEPGSWRRGLVWGSGILLVIAISAGALFVRRPRPRRKVSLITKAMKRPGRSD